MSLAVQQKITVFRRKLRRSLWMTGLCATIRVAVVAALCLAALDFSLRLEDPGLRTMLSCAFVAITLYALRRFLIHPLQKQMSDVAIAQKIESHSPELGDLLSNAVAFSSESESSLGAGSAALRRAVIVKATAASEEINWDQYLPRKKLRRAGIGMLFALAIVGTLVGFNASLVETGMMRLLRPFGTEHWPRAHQLVVQKAPERIASGSSIEIEVVDQKGTLPEKVWLLYRFQQAGEVVEQKKAMKLFNELAVADLESITQPIEFRVIGGDDQSMPWKKIDVIEPPRLRSLAVRLTPPAYTGYPTVDSQRHIFAFEGTGITLKGESTEPLRNARIVLDSGDSIEATLEKDKRHFFIKPELWTAKETTSYWIELTDEEGLVGGKEERFALRVAKDTVPTLTIESPSPLFQITN